MRARTTGLGCRVGKGPVMTALDEFEVALVDPIDLVEHIASTHDWLFDRRGDGEAAVEIAGGWTDYRLFFSWLDNLCALHVACGFELRTPPGRRSCVNDLLARINEKMAVGHFDLWPDEGLLVFRQTILLRGVAGASVEQLEDLFEIAVTECERYYPAFHHVVWGGKDASAAVSAAMIDTAGEA